MMIITHEKPIMSDAQYRALQAVDNRAGAVDVVRFRDCSVTTLLAMSAHPRRRNPGHLAWVVVQWGKVQKGKRTVRAITHATLTPAGINALDAERARRARAETSTRSITRDADPFALLPAAPALPF